MNRKNMQTALICLEIAGQINKIAVDSRAIAKDFALSENEPTLEELTRIAVRLGFKSSIKQLSIEKLASSYPMPIIFQTNDGIYMPIVQINDEKKEALVFDPIFKQAKLFSFEEIERISTGRFLVLKHKFLNDNARFGFGWFFDQIMKYKNYGTNIRI